MPQKISMLCLASVRAAGLTMRTFVSKLHKERGRPPDRPIGSFATRAVLAFGLAFTLETGFATAPTIGIPATRTYSIEEIGVSRGPHLNFDRYGRLAVISGVRYVVLNDDSWLDIADKNTDFPPLLDVLYDNDGNNYFGGLASWGKAVYTESGKLRPISMRPEAYPKWINSTNFTEILQTDQGILFSGVNGIVRLVPETGQLDYYKMPVSAVFSMGSKIFVTSAASGTQSLDLDTGETHTINPSVYIHDFAHLDDGLIVGATTDKGLVTFDGKDFTPFDFGLKEERVIRISCMETLPDGGFAIAVDGEGFFVFNASGERKLALTATEFRRIYDLASQEPGIIWLARESSVQKLLYNDPVSIIDQRSEVVIGWPQVVNWGDTSVIASNGRLYDMRLSENAWKYNFKEVKDVPISGAWAIAANDKHLLIGNGEGVYFRNPSGFTPIPGIAEANRLFFHDNDLCVVIGSHEIAAIGWIDGEWKECAEKIEGVGFPLIMHRTEDSVWLELGLDRVAKVWFEDGSLHKAIIENFPWDEPTWVNIGVLKEHIVLTGADNQRVYIDKTHLSKAEPPPIETALAQSPYIIQRLTEDLDGTVWATHPSGIITFRKVASGYQMDINSLRAIRDQYPVISQMDDSHVWISTESALYHVKQGFETSPQPQWNPFLVSIVNGKTGSQLYARDATENGVGRLPYAQNHLVFRYFAGGYAPLFEPIYEFTMQNGSENWKVNSTDSLLTLPSLSEGSYQLTAQLWDGNNPIGDPITTSFDIAPPWYRSVIAKSAYWSLGLALVLAVASWYTRHARRKHDYLEKLVHERTDELRETMEKLTEEARNSATLAERNRLAGEIHDSLQQGLSGLALQLDATLRQKALEPDLRYRLSIARRMVSFTRQEVQQAVWDLESPLLENEDLADALRNLAGLLGADSMRVKVQSFGEPIEIPSRTKHHLLRVAQEALTNAIRHSGAHSINVTLEFTESGVNLEVKDDGNGFDTNEVFSEGIGHFGLRSLRTRSAKIGGSLTIESNVGSGTRVCLSVPLASEVAHT